ncbi:ribosome maturation factor RimP [Candidatus Rickettsiella viridis]|uniref:Ribosome maturation factor RimP n=2 Tax=Candidatus Rickettsiella viridis TaxID=676208 RepID=A0A2Z5V545_9COXI|nr:ribosome maturation factor RimP [Candidatus Rickettsiella viridis]
MILPTVESLGYELWGCVYVTQGQRSILRVYIDSEQGIKLVDCERVSRQISALFNVENPILTRYNLEVSSPGLDRPLFTAEQFQRFIGYKVSVQTHTAIDNQRKFKGLLKFTTEEGIGLSSEGEDVTLTWDNIMRANVLPETIK